MRPVYRLAVSQPSAVKASTEERANSDPGDPRGSFSPVHPRWSITPGSGEMLCSNKHLELSFTLLRPLWIISSCPAGGTWARLQSRGIWEQTGFCVIHYSLCRTHFIFICAWEVGHPLSRGIQSAWKVFEKINYGDKEETVFLIIWSIVWLGWASYMTILLIIILFKCTNYMSFFFFVFVPALCRPAKLILMFVVVGMATPCSFGGRLTHSHQLHEDRLFSQREI